MDFSFTEEQRALRDLAARMFTDHSSPERLKAIERSDERIDRELWAALATAGLLGAGLPERDGGSGGGFVEVCIVLVEQGRRLPMVPLVPTIVSAALPLARFGSEEQRRILSRVLAGEAILSAALVEPLEDPRRPATRAFRDGNGWRLEGMKTGVPFAHLASLVLVPATLDGGGTAIFAVEAGAAGIALARQEPMSWEPQARLELAGVRVGPESILGSMEAGAAILEWLLERTAVALSAVASGASAEAIRLTAEYASNRKQFDRPIATFQAVGQRMADAYIDNEAVALTMWQAATRLHDETPSAREVAIAKYWASEGGSRIGHAALHVHGGISIDVDYPIHRYFLWLKQIESTLGAATPELARLGAMIASRSGFP